MTEIYVKVKPDADGFRIDTSTTYPTVYLENPAEQGRANTELITRLSHLLDTSVHIVSGHRSRRKKLRIDRPEAEILDTFEATHTP